MRKSFVAATGSLALVLTAPAGTPPLLAQEMPEDRVCMARMTQGRPGGDHEIRLQVGPFDAVLLASRGYQQRSCIGFADMLRDSVVEMCRTARLANPAIDQEFAAIHGLSPREMCEAGERM